MRFIGILILINLITTLSLAEYRVFTLHILNSKTQSTKQIETTLDPEQFIGFYPLANDEQISYIETWRCSGRTDSFKPHCNNPRLNRVPSAQLDEKPATTTSQSPEILK